MTARIHELPKPTEQAITGQRERTQHREAETAPTVRRVIDRTDPVTATAKPHASVVPIERPRVKAWNVAD